MGENKNTPSSARELLDNQPKQADETLFEVEQNITGLSSEKIITANEKIISEKATETNGLKTNNTSETADIKKNYMDVHHHAHTVRRKWIYYFSESHVVSGCVLWLFSGERKGTFY